MNSALLDRILVSDQGRRLFETWRSLCRDGRAPLWREFDPASVPDTLKFVSVLKPEGAGRLSIVIFGTELREVLDAEITGRDALEDIPGIEQFQLRDMLTTVAQGRHAFVTLRDVRPERGEPAQLQAMCLPTIDETGRIGRLISAFIPVSEDGRRLKDILEGGRAEMTMTGMVRYEIAADAFEDVLPA